MDLPSLSEKKEEKKDYHFQMIGTNSAFNQSESCLDLHLGENLQFLAPWVPIRAFSGYFTIQSDSSAI